MGESFVVCKTRFWEHSELVGLAAFSGVMSVVMAIIGVGGLAVGARMVWRGIRGRDGFEVAMGGAASMIALMSLAFLVMLGPKAACYVGSL
jgi:hypothetical protein